MVLSTDKPEAKELRMKYTFWRKNPCDIWRKITLPLICDDVRTNYTTLNSLDTVNMDTRMLRLVHGKHSQANTSEHALSMGTHTHTHKCCIPWTVFTERQTRLKML